MAKKANVAEMRLDGYNQFQKDVESPKKIAK